MVDSNNQERNKGIGSPITAKPDFPNDISMKVFEPLDKDKVWIEWQYERGCGPLGCCDALWSTAGHDDGQGQIGGCGSKGDFDCDDGKVEWQAYGKSEWERYFECNVRAGLTGGEL